MEPTELETRAARPWRRYAVAGLVAAIACTAVGLGLSGNEPKKTSVANRDDGDAATVTTALDQLAVGTDDNWMPEMTTTTSGGHESAHSTTSTTQASPGDDPFGPEAPTTTVKPHKLITEFALPHTHSEPANIVAGADGALWFSENTNHAIGRIGTGGKLTEFPLPEGFSQPGAIARGPDNALWFCDHSAPLVGRITYDGTITSFPVSHYGCNSLVLGPDGALWFLLPTSGDDLFTDELVRMTTDGDTFVLPFEKNAFLKGLTVGSDGNLWLANNATKSFLRVEPSTAITTGVFPFPTNRGYFVLGATSGGDGRVWFNSYDSDGGDHFVHAVTPSGTITTRAIDGQILTSVWGPDGNFWHSDNDAIVRITSAGDVTRFPVSGAFYISIGPDGNVWFSRTQGNKVGRLDLSAA